MFKSNLRKLWWSLAALLIAYAVFLSVGRALLPVLLTHNTTLEQLISERIGQPVKFVHVSGSWKGLEPVLTFSKVSLYQQNKPTTLTIGRVTVGIHLLESLLQRKLSTDFVLIDQVNLKLYQNQQHHFTIEGFEPSFIDSHHSASQQKLNAWLLTQKRVSFKHVNLHIHNKTLLLPINNLQLLITNHDEKHHIMIQAGLAQTVASTMRLIINFTGGPTDSASWQGQFYLQGDDLVLTQWLPLLPNHKLTISSGVGNVNLWGNFSAEQVTRLQSQFALSNLNLVSSVDHTNQLIQKLSANVLWQRASHAWEIAADHIQLQMNGQAWPENTLSYRYQSDTAGSVHHQLQLGFVKLHDLTSLLATSTQLPAFIKQLKMQGELSQSVFTFNQVHQQISDWHLQTHFKRLGWHANQHLPGVNNLSGQLNLTPKGAQVSLNSHNAAIALLQFFPKPLSLSAIKGDLLWQRDDDGDKISSTQFTMQQEQNQLNSAFSVIIPAKTKVPKVNLFAQLELNQFAHYRDYLPLKVMPKKLAHWLSAAKLSGKSMAVNIALQGQLNQFPFDQGNGLLKIDAALQDMNLHYWDAWPDATAMTGQMHFLNRHFSFDLVKGQLLDLSAKQLSANIDHLGGKQEVLRITAKSEDDVSHLIQFLNHSPLRKRFGVLDSMTIKGPMSTHLKLVLPFHHTFAGLIVKGQVQLQKNCAFASPKCRLPRLTLSLPACDLNDSAALKQSAILTNKFGSCPPAKSNLKSSGYICSGAFNKGSGKANPIPFKSDWIAK